MHKRFASFSESFVADAEDYSKVICSHHVFSILCKIDERFYEVARQHEELDFNRHGTFSLNDLLLLSEANPALFEQIQVYKDSE